MKNVIFVALLAILGSLPAQESDTTFFDDQGEFCKLDIADYYEISELGKNSRIIKAYYLLSHQLKYEGKESKASKSSLEAYYVAPPILKQKQVLEIDGIHYLRNGYWETYHNNGQRASKTLYRGGVKYSKATTWYANGQKEAQWEYQNKSTRVVKCWDEKGTEIVEGRKGLVEGYYDTGQLEYRGFEISGQRAGRWDIWYEDGQLMHQFTIQGWEKVGVEEIWNQAGQKIFQEVHAETEPAIYYWNNEGDIIFDSKKDGFEESEDWPELGSRQPLPLNMDEVRKSIGYPEVARTASIEGTVIMRVLVNEEGSIEEVICLKRVHILLLEAVQNHLLELKCVPAIHKGVYCSSWINIPFRFKLTN